MNLALSALLILLLLLPAFTFRIGISIPFLRSAAHDDASGGTDSLVTRNLAKVLSKLSFTESVFLFSIIPLVLHLLSLLAYLLTPSTIRFDILLNIFSGKDNVVAPTEDHAFHGQLTGFLLYILLEVILGLVLGILLGRALGGKRWLLGLLLGNNIWFKIFSGASLPAGQRRKIAYVIVEILAETKETSIIYYGMLKHYDVVPNTEKLAYITLAVAMRRDLREAQLADSSLTGITSTRYADSYGQFIEIPGYSFTVMGDQIKNVNVTYLQNVLNPETGEEEAIPIE